MTKYDVKYRESHKDIYNRLLDELDTKTVQKIMNNPFCDEAVLLNERVKRELKSTELADALDDAA